MFEDIIKILSNAEMVSYILEGLFHSILVTVIAAVLGLFLGFVVAVVKIAPDNKWMKPLKIICNLYTTVFRGTPVALQLFIMVFAVFAIPGFKPYAAIITFGINSGAYVAEILRGGIMSIDNGQFEAGRSLGFNYVQTMFHIIIPQVFKSVLPTLCNEFIVLLKETSIAGYVGIMDLTKAGDRIRDITFKPLLPLIVIALIYLVMVVVLTALVGVLERRLRRSER